mmetsp:Transcript_10634/g.30100  ORF Transcript_10634/g.30100 Transcript_10634/m.30100 type:complete len:220 (+) Transcript_10634:2005-2664(+)
MTAMRSTLSLTASWRCFRRRARSSWLPPQAGRAFASSGLMGRVTKSFSASSSSSQPDSRAWWCITPRSALHSRWLRATRLPRSKSFSPLWSQGLVRASSSWTPSPRLTRLTATLCAPLMWPRSSTTTTRMTCSPRFALRRRARRGSGRKHSSAKWKSLSARRRRPRRQRKRRARSGGGAAAAASRPAPRRTNCNSHLHVSSKFPAPASPESARTGKAHR